MAEFDPVVARVLAARAVGDPAEMDFALARLHPPGMADLEAAVERLAAAVQRRERVLVVGDFDADGATSTALAVRALRMLGHNAVDYLVPNRFDDGYGLSRELVASAREGGAEVILTVDNGVSSHDGVDAAREAGIDVVITDHHVPPQEIPAAVAVVNPNRPDCPFPSPNLAGVGVAFYVLAALRTRLQQTLRNGDTLPSMARLLDLVALGTLADVVPLDANNRILVEQGLRRLRADQGTAGVAALLRSSNRDPLRATAMDLAYGAAPRLNAAGRMADMGIGIETLLADDEGEARRLAGRLDALNRDRRTVEAEMKAQADRELSRLQAKLGNAETLPAVIVLHDGRWHQGVSGILASRMRQAIHRPIVVFADAGEGLLRGSCRSVPGLHMRDALAAVDTRRPGLMRAFGGHAMAAGLTLPAASLDDFREALNDEVVRVLGELPPVPEILTDGPLAAEELSLATAERLRTAAPWGCGFPAPSFDGRFRIRDHRLVGSGHLKLRVTAAEAAGGDELEAMVFNADPGLQMQPGDEAHFVFRPEVNAFRGRRALQLVVEHLDTDGDGRE